MKTIEITITPKGETIAETKGFEGASCQQASEFLTKALRPHGRMEIGSAWHSLCYTLDEDGPA